MINKDEILTLKAVLLYIIRNNAEDKRDVYSIVKTAFYAQQIHLAKWGILMYRDNIAALPFGPVPSIMYNILKVARGGSRRELSRYGCLRECVSSAAAAIGFSDESFYAKEDPDMKYISRSGIECLDLAIAKVADMNFNDIKNDTHGEEWNRAYHSPDKTMDPVGIARDGGADEDVIDYLIEGLELEKALA